MKRLLKWLLKDEIDRFEISIESLKREINSVKIQTESVESLTMTQFYELLNTKRDVIALREANLTKKKK